MEIVRTFEDAFAIGSACLAKINPAKTRPRLMDDYTLPFNLEDGPWEMSEDVLYQTLSYIMNFLNHSCYMICINGDEQKMVKLETQETSQFFKDLLLQDIRAKQDAKINAALLTETQRLKKLRIMQCVVKPYAAESKTSAEYEALFRKIRAPDGVYILNLTDAVLLRKNGYIPWKLNRNVKMPVAYQMEKFIPVLSISGEEGYWDIPIPNYDDVQYVLTETHPDPKYELVWSKKKNKAVFRGGPTGCGTTAQTNMRIKLAEMGLNPKYADLLDVGIVSNKPDTIDSDAIRYDPKLGLSYMHTNLKPVARMPMSDQSTFKYIIHIDGNVHAYRLLTTMRTGSLILRVKSDYRSWLDHVFEEYEARGERMFVSVRADLSDLISKIEYCNSHSEECRLIAERGARFAEMAMTPAYVVNAIEAVMWKLSDNLLKVGDKLGYIPQSQPKHEQYAVVGDGDDKRYFVKEEGEKRWHSDPLIQSIMNMNIRNSEDVLCVLQDMCFSTSLNSATAATATATATALAKDGSECITEEMAVNRISTDLFQQFYHYFDNAYFLSKDELDNSIEKEAKYSDYVYPILEHIQTAARLVYNNSQYQLGKTAAAVMLPVSPIQEMVNLIMADTDESRKRRLVVSLVESQKYVYQGVATEDSTVYAGEKENVWWYYCIQTHVKLMPRFLYVLATAVLRNPRDYDVIRSNLIQEIGEQTDDGIFDKNTGVLIERIPLVAMETFDESGFKIQTGAVFEDADGDADADDGEIRRNPLLVETDEEKRISAVEDMLFNEFENEDGHLELETTDDGLLDGRKQVLMDDNNADNQQITLDITGNKILDILNDQTFRLKFSVPIVETLDMLITELTDKLPDAYEQYLLKKPKNVSSREDYIAIQRTTYILILYIYMVELFVSKKIILQKISDIKGDKYDRESNASLTDMLTLYLSKRVIHIFKTLKKERKAWPASYMNLVMETSQKHKLIAALIAAKRGDVLKETLTAQLKHNIEQELSLRYVAKTKAVIPQTKWPQFLPPQNPQDLFGIETCAELGTIAEVAAASKRGHAVQPQYLFARMIFLSFCIQRTIQALLNTDKYRDSLLLNIKIYNQINSCCVQQVIEDKKKENGKIRFGATLEFFNKNSPNEDLIERYDEFVKKIEKQLTTMRSMSRSFLSNVDTEIAYPILPHRLNEIVMEEGIDFLMKMGLIKSGPNPDTTLQKQFMQDYMLFSRLTMNAPPEFAEVKRPIIQLIATLKVQEEVGLSKEDLSSLLSAFYRSGTKNGDGNGDDGNENDILITLKRLATNKLKNMKKIKRQQLEKIFKKMDISVLFASKKGDEDASADADTDVDADINAAYTYLTFLRNYVLLIGRVFPEMFNSGAFNRYVFSQYLPITRLMDPDELNSNPHSSWYDFSNVHMGKIHNMLEKRYEKVVNYTKKYKDNDNDVIAPYFEQIMHDAEPWIDLARTTYYQPAKQETTQYTFQVMQALFEYYISNIFEIYDKNYDEKAKDMDDENEENELEQLADAHQTLLDFSLEYLSKTAEIDVIDRNYSKVMDVVFKHKENEKNKFRKRLEKMSRDERMIYQEERKLGIGEYNAKNYAGLKKYDAAFYDKTKEVREELQEQEDNDFDEKEAELMVRGEEEEEDGDYNNVFEDDGYY